MVRGGVGGAGVDIRIGGDAPEHSLSGRELQKVVFDVVIPPKLAWANHAFILRNVKEPGHAVPAYLRTPQSFRPFELLALPAAGSDGTLHLVDVPTTMSVMAFAIDERLNVATPEERDRQRGWVEIEAREIDRFRSHLVRRIERTQNGFHPFRRVVSVVNWRAVFPAPTIF
jgi:hypothetical protein